jgi:hypothetical protein
MAQDNPYYYITVESFIPEKSSGLHGKIHIRPIKGERFPQTIHVECSKQLSTNYPLGTKFKIKAKLTDREDGGEYLYSSYHWPYEVVS